MAIGITENDVWAAADALLMEGLRPTIERVRQKIGRGSPNTVQPYLDTWFKGLGARIADPMAFAASGAIPEPVDQAARHFWEVACTAARASLAQEEKAQQEEFHAARALIERDRESLRHKEAAYAMQIDAVTSALDQSQARLFAAEQRVAEREITLLASQSIEQQLRETIESAREELEAARGRSDQERQSLQERAREQEIHWLSELDRARNAAKKAEQRREALEKELGTLRAAAGKAAAEHGTTLASASTRIATLEDELKAQVAEQLTLRSAFMDAERRAAAAEAALSELRRTTTTLGTSRRSLQKRRMFTR